MWWAVTPSQRASNPHHSMDGALLSQHWNHTGPSWKRGKESDVGGAELLETIPGFVNRKKQF